jgi:hypothetical protein
MSRRFTFVPFLPMASASNCTSKLSAGTPATATAPGRGPVRVTSPVRPIAWRSRGGIPRPFASFSKVEANLASLLPRA